MEGLIPMVYKSIKKSRTRRHYEYLGSSSAPTPPPTTKAAVITQNIADFYYANDDPYNMAMNGEYAKKEGHHHRRYKSFQVDYTAEQQQQPKKLVRFRSHKFLSCITASGA